MPTTAFGRAMLESVNNQPQRFCMTMQDGPTIQMSCRDFLTTRTEENHLLDDIELPTDGSVLDYGCGVGRHLARIRQSRQSVHCYGIEFCDLLRTHCKKSIAAPATFFEATDDLVQKRKFDLIMLMGNGLGVLGCEQDAVTKLTKLVGLLAPKGRIIIETGNPFGHGYCAPCFTIEYGSHTDGPFAWGYADRAWITRTLEQLDCSVRIIPSKAPGGMFFFAVAQRNG